MDQLVKLAKDSIKYYLENEKYLSEYDESLKKNNNGAIVIINKDGKTESSGSIYPTRSDIGLDVIYEAVNLTVFNNAIDLRDTNIDDLDIMVYEVTKVSQIQYLEDFGMYHGLLLKYNNNSALVFRNDYESDYQMFEDAIEIANVDSHDVFTLEKFKIIKHI
ncbi:hypothetical protein [uncultured Anaerococcus sp.]|uniref:hypothetical protein n=1 Tax=uncultured Anaerococcus sp. TaxID=293428 RepID=UPI00262D3C2D|nr:hypothetical protein [uncultured Anaerococcus sp.]